MRPTDLTTGLTQDRLKALLHYEPATGVFTWLVSPARCVKAGAQAGTFSKSVGRFVIKVDDRNYYASRLAWLYMTGEWPEARVDHRDTDKTNDRWENLRAATMTQNQHNTGLTSRNSTGFKGVCYQASRRRWQANIRVDGTLKFLGRFAAPELAHAAYAAAAARYFGPYARTS